MPGPVVLARPGRRTAPLTLLHPDQQQRRLRERRQCSSCARSPTTDGGYQEMCWEYGEEELVSPRSAARQRLAEGQANAGSGLSVAQAPAEALDYGKTPADKGGAS